ncbi:MHFG family PEP-CTERM protein [Roseateles asaccharophilus]|uniref:Ice-binding protein C-terminal domain-containing protein n=1 Tax=Roseateles asaccharophilus TaxID=582607 RepID=A0ABU2AFX9_9BURK|nr:MHFG family PEP-CTERM protein [Roseateles asaccharophilus]MDR7335518.1 hypothetical protein [Roseateles asaccharophilus]
MPRLASLLIATACALGTTTAGAATERNRCEWQSPAHDPYQGSVPDAIDSYTDIPAATRERLKARMQEHDYDDIVSIRRDSIDGRFRYEPALRDMHFGQQRRCGTVTRASWKPDHAERALTYCEDGHCVAVPTVCRNVSRITRAPDTVAAGAPAGGAPNEPLAFDPPSAGLPMAAVPAPDEPTTRTLQADPPAVTRITPLPANTTPAPQQTLPQPLPLPGTGMPGEPLPPSVPSVPPIDLPSEVPVVVIVPPPEPPAPILEPEPNFPSPTPPGVIPLPPAPAVPEPATLLMWVVGVAAGVAWRRRSASRGR